MNDFEGIDLAAHLNAECHCISLDAARLQAELERVSPGFHAGVMEGRPHLFADVTVFVSETHARQMAELVSAIDAVVELPQYRRHVLSYAPELARHPTTMRGAFLGYDFHLSDAAPQLIEINTNAGGGLLNALVARAHRVCCDQVHTATNGAFADDRQIESSFLEMFENEWRLFQEAKHDSPRRLRTVAIVDELPETQFLYPEFILFRRLFEHAGIRAIVCAPHELNFHDGALWHNDCEQAIDLVYNRLTDFALEGSELSPLRNAWLADVAAITPHPYAHALYADKRNLVTLTDDALLQGWGVAAATRATLAAGIPKTEHVAAAAAASLWARRKRLFFKPAAGFGSRAAYRGDKLTTRVFDAILAECVATPYIAQALATPTSRRMRLVDQPVELKLDLRNYIYDGKVQLSAARLWQGQTTNFRTPGGGFAPVLTVPTSCKQGAT